MTVVVGTNHIRYLRSKLFVDLVFKSNQKEERGDTVRFIWLLVYVVVVVDIHRKYSQWYTGAVSLHLFAFLSTQTNLFLPSFLLLLSPSSYFFLL